MPSISLTSDGALTLDPILPFTLNSNSAGAGTVTLTGGGRTTSFDVTAKTVPSGSTTKNHGSFVPSYLSHHCEEAVNSRIQGATTEMLPIFLNYDSSNSSGNYTRNPDCWIYDLRQAATCISPWNSRGGKNRAGTLLTPRHVGQVAHSSYYNRVGDTIRFVTADNTTITRTVVGVKVHPNYAPYFPDIVLLLLDSDLPSSITPCKVLPANYANYFPTGVAQIATLGLDQEEKALVTDLSSLSSTSASFRYPNLPYEQILYENKILGDSGNPAFLIINNEFACLTFWTFGGAGSGTFLTPQIQAMNQMIMDLDTAAGIDTGYTIQTVNLSSFPVA